MTRASQAHLQPNKHFSVAIDGMDTTKTELPFSAHRHGTSQKAWHLRVHIVGVLIHGRHPICFMDYHQFPHDSNLLINIFLQVGALYGRGGNSRSSLCIYFKIIRKVPGHERLSLCQCEVYN